PPLPVHGPPPRGLRASRRVPPHQAPAAPFRPVSLVRGPPPDLRGILRRPRRDGPALFRGRGPVAPRVLPGDGPEGRDHRSLHGPPGAGPAGGSGVEGQSEPGSSKREGPGSEREAPGSERKGQVRLQPSPRFLAFG